MDKPARSRPGQKGKPTKDDQRAEKLAQVQAALAVLQANHEAVRAAQVKGGILESVSLGLYEELDKLTKKAPAEEVTELVLEQINEIVRDVRGIMPSDNYVQRLREFIPAGDMPQQRDVLVVLRQVRQGLERLRITSEAELDRFSELIAEAELAQFALQYYVEFGDFPVRDAAEVSNVTPVRKWFDGAYGQAKFRFSRLDALDVEAYFSVRS